MTVNSAVGIVSISVVTTVTVSLKEKIVVDLLVMVAELVGIGVVEVVVVVIEGKVEAGVDPSLDCEYAVSTVSSALVVGPSVEPSSVLI